MPYLNSLSPHVANGDNVGQLCVIVFQKPSDFLKLKTKKGLVFGHTWVPYVSEALFENITDANIKKLKFKENLFFSSASRVTDLAIPSWLRR